MSRHPTSDDGCKFTNLQSETAVVPRRNAECIFVEPNLGSVITRVEAAIQSRLREEINLRSELCVEKKCQARVEKIVDLAVDEPRGGLLEMINLDVDRAAQARSKIILKSGDGERAIEPVENIIHV